MQGNLFKNITVVLVCLTLLLIFVFITEKFGQQFLLQYTFRLILVVYFITSLYLNKNMFINVKNIYVRYLLILVLCALLTVVFGIFALIIGVNFNLAIGGKI
ncbi:MAG: hypothetical protein CVU62_11280 [Deltaproteobacteria bacterium HGW-Deltaproteobacteria-2]|jgi:hypothetical protein|nr:MAG: hypothetical protein CVU62_11280 [Deltaproteobacteria bacterium HGW-Deltaproteobacteria-2]